MMKEKTTVSFFFALAMMGNVNVTSLGAISSATHSLYSSAPNFIQTLEASLANFTYALILFLGTVRTNPSTYLIIGEGSAGLRPAEEIKIYCMVFRYVSSRPSV